MSWKRVRAALGSRGGSLLTPRMWSRLGWLFREALLTPPAPSAQDGQRAHCSEVPCRHTGATRGLESVTKRRADGQRGRCPPQGGAASGGQSRVTCDASPRRVTAWCVQEWGTTGCPLGPADGTLSGRPRSHLQVAENRIGLNAFNKLMFVLSGSVHI